MAHLKNEFGNLARTRKNLLSEIKTLSFAEFNNKLDSDNWSIAQVCHHLYLAEKSFTKAIIYGLRQPSTDRVAPKPIHFLTDRSRKIPAPDMVIPINEPLELQQINHLLLESRTNLLDVLNKIEDESVLEKKAAKHLLFGELPLYQWIETVYLHEQRHIDQIKEIKSRIL